MTMGFSEAFERLQDKYYSNIYRSEWDKVGMFVELQRPNELSKMTHPYLFINVPDCEKGLCKAPWQPAQVDLFAEDWEGTLADD